MTQKNRDIETIKGMEVKDIERLERIHDIVGGELLTPGHCLACGLLGIDYTLNATTGS